MILIKEIINTVFTSKTYIIYKRGETDAWLVDIGDIEPVLSFADEKGLFVRGVFITHAHFDHIYGLLSLLVRFPECKVYCTEYCKMALASDKLNMSKYHGTPFSYEGDNVNIVHEGNELLLYEDDFLAQIYETPGHNPGCMTIVLGDMVFTGDAYIPGIKVNTTLPYANKEDAAQSINKISSLSEGKIVLPGHFV